MANNLILSDRDRALLRVLSWTPATTTLLLQASSTFPGTPFLDERRLRERLQSLGGTGFVRSWASAHAGGGIQNYYKLTPAGFQTLEGGDAVQPPKAFFAEISPSLFDHTMQLAEVIVATLRGCHEHRVTILAFHRENDLTFAVGDRLVQPDCFFRFQSAGKNFSVAFEVDLSTEPVDSMRFQSIRRKLQTYDDYQAMVLSQWLQNGRAWERPRFRVAFLTRSIDRAYHILSLAGQIAENKSRRLVYAATLDSFQGEQDPIRSPIFLDHFGSWHALVNLHPTSPTARPPVRLPPPVENLLVI